MLSDSIFFIFFLCKIYTVKAAYSHKEKAGHNSVCSCQCRFIGKGAQCIENSVT